MEPNRTALDDVASDQLQGSRLIIRWGDYEAREYTLQSKLGRGQTGVAWKATDRFGRTSVIKFVLRSDYRTHSLDAEAHRVSALSSRRISRIEFYGEPNFAINVASQAFFYAIVVEWVNGTSLEKYLRTEGSSLTVEVFLRLARSFCELLADLASHELSHNDLHAENVRVSRATDPLTGDLTAELIAIDTGALKTENRRLELLEDWRLQHDTLVSAGANHEQLKQRLAVLMNRIRWWERTDQQWVVAHLCTLFNCLQRRVGLLDAATRRFLKHIPDLLDRMDDPDPSRRLSDPRQMYVEIETAWATCQQPESPQMTSPFELMSAELIRSDLQLMELFSDEFPGLAECRGSDPVYLYGPRGCGKSTLLRSLSTKAILRSAKPTEELAKVGFVGIYVSCSSELRSRFWLMPSTDYDVLEAHVVRYFNLVLIEELIDTLNVLAKWDAEPGRGMRFGLSDDVAIEIVRRIRLRLLLSKSGVHFSGTSHFDYLKSQVRSARDSLWSLILDKLEPAMRTDAQLLFDVCRDIAEVCPFFKERQIAFLLDDYSNQRIPIGLQRKLNQSISFAKQGTPVFKVTSEYMGVDLAGIQEGREVREINVGDRFVGLTDERRWLFLNNVLNKRLEYLNYNSKVLQVLPLSHVSPGIPMAEAIKAAYEDPRKPFYYHGLDTISDLCSGDFAMGLDLVRKICEEAKIDWRKPMPVPAKVQHTVIQRHAAREHEYLRYLSPNGRAKYDVVGQLCWLARESVIKCSTTKDGRRIPLIKIHLDISERVLSELETDDPEKWAMLQDLIHKGVLFPLDTSRAREQHQGTMRFQIRRILLARPVAPLGRHTSIRIDNREALRFLLSEPLEFVRGELQLNPSEMLWPDREEE